MLNDKNFGFAQKSAKLWNAIPVHVRQCKDDNKFKVEAKKFVPTLVLTNAITENKCFVRLVM